MEKIKTVCIGTITPDFMAKLNECCDITMGGYAVTGLNTMPEDELIDLLKGASFTRTEALPFECDGDSVRVELTVPAQGIALATLYL